MTSPNDTLQVDPDNTKAIKYRVGIRFTSLGSPGGNSDSSVSVKHWCLVITPVDEPGTCRTVEVYSTVRGSIGILDQLRNIGLPSFALAEYEGLDSDIDKVLEAHPAKGLAYSACYNNCQHFAATFLLLLQVLANEKPNKSLRIIDPDRMHTVQSVLVVAGTKIYNRPNILMQLGAAKVLALSSCGVAGLQLAAEATVTSAVTTAVTSTVPASGIAGWFGATTSVTTYVTNLVVTPAAYASFAAIAAPAVAIATVSAGGGYLLHRYYWTSQTTFNDPRFYGFPEEELRPLTPAERMQKEDMESSSHISLFGSSASSTGGPSTSAANGLAAGTVEELMEEMEKRRNAPHAI
jgi:hypothetical protein